MGFFPFYIQVLGNIIFRIYNYIFKSHHFGGTKFLMSNNTDKGVRYLDITLTEKLEEGSGGVGDVGRRGYD